MHVVGTKGQIVIAQALREQLGVEPGWLTVQRVVDDHLELHFIPPPHRESLKGTLSAHITRTVPEEGWGRVREDAWVALAGPGEEDDEP